MGDSDLLGVAFLGLADRADLVRDGPIQLTKWNLLGLRSLVPAPFFPLPLVGTSLILAIRAKEAGVKLTLIIRAEDGKEVGRMVAEIQTTRDAPEEPLTRTQSPYAVAAPESWVLVAAPGGDFLIERLGRYFVRLQRHNGSEETVGELAFGLVEFAPLTPERIAAIRSDPRSAKAVRIVLGCKKCSSTCRMYTGLDRNIQVEHDGYVWCADAVDQFACECGSTLIDTTTIKRNLIALLGQPMRPTGGPVSFIPQYEAAILESIRIEFLHLVDRNVLEEQLQKFIEQNPVLLHQFPAERIFFKPPILTFFNADFAILTPQRELVLIEIERASARLLKKDGGQAAELSHAIDQVHGWLQTIEEHRTAVLDSLGIAREVVSRVRGVVIAGRDRGNDAAHLRRLKGRHRGDITLLTFDDLASGLAVLAQQMRNL